MASPPPLQFDAIYHIYNRGNNRENIFIEDRNYPYFLQLYAKHLEHVVDSYAYCLLRNHFHLGVRVKTKKQIQAALTAAQKPIPTEIGDNFASLKFANFFTTYAKGINKAYQRSGSLFEHPFGRVQITSGRQFWQTVTYIHQNPQRHGFIADFRNWKWSSYAALVSDKPTRLKRDAVLKWFGGRQEFIDLHQELVELDIDF